MELDVPQIQLVVGVQDTPVVSQRQLPTVAVLSLQVQFLEVVDMPVVVQRQVRAAARDDKVVNIPVESQRLIPMVPSPSLQMTIAIPLLQYVDKMVHVLVVQVAQVLRCWLWR